MRDFAYSLFFPHPKNNHKAYLLSSKSLFLATLFFIISAFFFSSSINPLHSISVQADVSIIELLNLTNQKRIDNDLKPLKENQQLNQAASKKAIDMFDKNYWAHNSPDGVTPWVFIKGSGYDYVYAGENLARGFTNATDVVNAWMASPTHRENLLSPNYEDVGFSIRAGKLNGEDTILVVQEFGSKNPSIMADQPSEVKGEKFSVFLPIISSINNFNYSDNFVVIVLLVLVLLLVLDLFLLDQKKIVRFAGHNEDHIMYVIAIIVIIFIITTGVII